MAGIIPERVWGEWSVVTMVTLTSEAKAQLRSVLERQNKLQGALRVYVAPGGCSGFSYGMALEDEVDPGDAVLEYDGVRVVVDEFSAQYLQGAEIDYEDNLMNGGFQVRNPNAVKSCACGQSFDSFQGGGAPKPCS
jgi:iron-sulfur cluster assembly protein